MLVAKDACGSTRAHLNLCRQQCLRLSTRAALSPPIPLLLELPCMMLQSNAGRQLSSSGCAGGHNVRRGADLFRHVFEPEAAMEQRVRSSHASLETFCENIVCMPRPCLILSVSCRSLSAVHVSLTPLHYCHLQVQSCALISDLPVAVSCTRKQAHTWPLLARYCVTGLLPDRC